MKKKRIQNGVLLFCLLACLFFCPALSATETIVTIGTGEVTGVFYQTGGAISRLMNKKRHQYNIRCVVESTNGSVFNVDAVVGGELDFGFVQSDRQYQAFYGQAEWKEKGPQTQLRSVFSLYTEACTLCASADSDIRGLTDLKGKIVNIGHPGSGHRQNSIDALTAAGIDYQKDLKVEDLNPLEASRRLKDGKIDAFFYTVGHPTGAIIDATMGRKIRIIPMPVIADKLVKKYSYYTNTHIPIRFYKRTENVSDVYTFGVKATFVTSPKVSDEVVYLIVREVMENFDFFKSLHTAFRDLDKTEMVQHLTAPIHPGAMKYYEEVGLK